MLSKSSTTLTLLALLFLVLSTSGIELIPAHLNNKYGEALEAIFSMGVRVESLLQTGPNPGNFLISPLSITLLLGQMVLGAEGKFKDQLYDLLTIVQHTNEPKDYNKLHFQMKQLMQDLRRNPNNSRHFTLESANALFVNRLLPLNEKFVHETRLFYETDVKSVNFRKGELAMRIINGWGANHTNNLIRNTLSSPPEPSTGGIFANAIYFYGKWQQPFSSELNNRGPFHISTRNSIEAMFMTGFIEQVPYAESKRLNCKMLVLPYEDRELGMYIILPNVGHVYEYDIKRFANETKLKDFFEMLGDLQDRDVAVKIPKLQLTSSMSLLRPLQKYAAFKKMQLVQPIQTRFSYPREVDDPIKGVLDILEDGKKRFDSFNSTNTRMEDIYLTGASGSLKVSDILHQMTFSVNEVGTEAAAVSASIVDYSGGSKSFLANKPFMFFIRHEATAATLFWGTITNPNH